MASSYEIQTAIADIILATVRSKRISPCGLATTDGRVRRKRGAGGKKSREGERENQFHRRRRF